MNDDTWFRLVARGRELSVVLLSVVTLLPVVGVNHAGVFRGGVLLAVMLSLTQFYYVTRQPEALLKRGVRMSVPAESFVLAFGNPRAGSLKQIESESELVRVAKGCLGVAAIEVVWGFAFYGLYQWMALL